VSGGADRPPSITVNGNESLSDDPGRVNTSGSPGFSPPDQAYGFGSKYLLPLYSLMTRCTAEAFPAAACTSASFTYKREASTPSMGSTVVRANRSTCTASS